MAEERRGARVTLAPWALVLAALLLAPFAEASLPRAAETDGAVLRVASLAEPSRLAPLAAADDVERFALFAGNDLAPELAPLASRVREDRFSLHLGADVFDVEPLRGPPPLSEDLCQGDDECLAGTRIGGLDLEGPFFTEGQPRLSLELQWACSVSSCELADGKPLDPWGLESSGAFGAIDRRDRGITNPIAGTIDPEAVAREAAATAVEELSYVGIANGLTSSLLGYDFVRKEEVKGPLARILAGISVVPGIPATVRKIDEIPGLKNAAKFDLPGGAPGTVGNWVEGLKRWDTPTAKRSGLFEVEQTGPFNFRVHGGGEKVDIDGFLDTTVLDAKFVDKPNVSPFVPGSDIKPEIRKVIHDKVRNEFRRLSAVIADPSVPFRRLEVRVNDPKAVPFFESLMSEYGIPGGVNIVETGVKRRGAP